MKSGGAVAETGLDGVADHDRVSLRAVLVIDGQDPTEALNAAGIVDPVAVPVVFGDGSDGGGQMFEDGLQAVLEFQADDGGADLDRTQANGMTPASWPAPLGAGSAGTGSDGGAADDEGARANMPRTAMLPPGPLGQALAPIRPRR